LKQLLNSIKFLGLISLLAIIGACSSTPDVGQESNLAGEKALMAAKPPEWVMKGEGASKDSGGRYFYAVGSASGIKNYSLQRRTADNRARNEVAKVMKLYTKSLMKDYQASTTAGDISASHEEQNIEEAIKTVTAATLSGVQIVNHWEHPARGELFSLARLDLEAFKTNLGKHEKLSKEVREAIQMRADSLHEEMELEVQQMK
jgi:hypothetical protein